MWIVDDINSLFVRKTSVGRWGIFDLICPNFGAPQFSKQQRCKMLRRKPLNWIISDYSVEKKARKTLKTAKKAVNFSKYPKVF